MCPVSPSPFHSFRSDFADWISRKFEDGRFLIIGANPDALKPQFAEAKREAVIASSFYELMAMVGQGEDAAQFEVAVWFYPSGDSDDERVIDALARCAASVVLAPGPGADSGRRRPQLVQSLGRYGFLPDYDFDVSELDLGAVCVRRRASEPLALVPAMEAALARLNTQLNAIQRTVRLRNSELEGAHRHIAALEEKLLKLKEYRRELKLLRAERLSLRKSPERRLGQVFLAPYRLPEKLVKTVWKKLHRIEGKPRRSTSPSEYQQWFQRHRAGARDLERMRDEVRVFTSRPLISIVTPVFNTPVQRLEEAVKSVLGQVYENWELLLIDDGSSAGDLRRALPRIAARDQRIVLASLGKHEGISAASNRGLALARGEWVAFLDHDDVLEPDALFHVAKLLQSHPDAGLIYSDEDKLGEDGFEAPVFKPDWSPDFFLSCNYIGHLTAVRRDLVQKVGGFRSSFDSAQDYDLFFRVIAQTNRIHHIPRVLYHWRRSESSSAISVRQKPQQLEASRLAIEDHLKCRGEPAHVAVDWRTHAFCVRRELRVTEKISVIVQNRHGPELLERCLETLRSKTSYPDYEILVVHCEEKSREAIGRFSRLGYQSIAFPSGTNESAIRNFGVKQTENPWILFLDDSIEVIEPDWLTIMAEHVQRPEVGAVGARLLNPGGTIEHAGFVVGVNGSAQPAFHGFPAEHPGLNRQLQVTRNCSAVSSACMLIRHEVFQQVGGFDENLTGMLADVDLCLKMRRAGYLIVYTPFAKLHWHEAEPEKVDAGAEALMRERWADVLRSDPYYNPNLSRERADFSLAK
jgi:GT2 family glycosyltransferase